MGFDTYSKVSIFKTTEVKFEARVIVGDRMGVELAVVAEMRHQSWCKIIRSPMLFFLIKKVLPLFNQVSS